MVWSDEKDLDLLKEVAVEGVLKQRQKSRDKGAGWQKLADNLNFLGFEITARSARDHFGMVSNKYKAKMAKEKRSTGEGRQELTERESLLEELIEISEETDMMMENEDAMNKQKREREKSQAMEMRERAMEKFGNTRKRTTSDKDGEQVKKRRRSGDMFNWLSERIELGKEEKEQGRKEKKEEREDQKAQQMEFAQLVHTTQQQFSVQMKLSEQYLQHQMQQQQQQEQQQQQQFAMLQQQMMAFMQQQQQQTQLLANLILKKD